jgi:type II restriction enzyme
VARQESYVGAVVFLTEAAIQKRNPLNPSARRAGWVGCSILLSVIPPEGKIRLVNEGTTLDPVLIRANYQKIRPIAQMTSRLRGGTLNVLRFVHKIGRPQFRLEEIYAFERDIANLYPANRNVRAKIRQQLQILRDLGILTFLGRGQYALTDLLAH